MRRAVVVVLAAGLLLALYALAGFVLAPYWVEKYLPAMLGPRLGNEIRFGAVAFNPFLLRLEARDAVLAAPEGTRVAEIPRLVADLDWASFTGRTWVLSELLVDGARFHLVRREDGSLEIGRPPPDDSTASSPDTPAEPEPPPVVTVRRLVFDDARLRFTDRRSDGDAELELGPVRLEADGLSTLPDTRSEYRLQAGLPAGAALAAAGTLALADRASDGSVQLTGFVLDTVWPFVRDTVALAPPEGRLDLSATYRFAAPALQVEDIAITLAGLRLARADAPGTPLLVLQRAGAEGGRFDADNRSVEIPRVELADGSIALEIDEQGRSGWSGLVRESDTEPSAPAPWRLALPAIRVGGLALRHADRQPESPRTVTVDSVAGTFGLEVDGGENTRLRVAQAEAELGRIALADGPEIASARLTGGHFDSAARKLGAESITLRGGSLAVRRDKAGTIALGVASGELKPVPPASRPRGSPASAEPAQAPPADPPLDYALGRLAVEDFRLAFEDRSHGRPVVYDATAALTLTGIERTATTPIGIEATLRIAGKSRLAVRGSLAQDASRADARVELEDFPLTPLQPVIARHAAVVLRSGRLGGKVELRYAAQGKPRLRASGRVYASGLDVKEAASGDPLLSARTVSARGRLTLGPDRLQVDEMILDRPAAKIEISRERQFNLAELVIEHDAGVPPTPTSTGRAAEPFPVRIGRIDVRDGTVAFADYSLVLPFSTRVHSFGGTVLGVDSRKGSEAVVEAEGRIEPYGAAHVEGRLRPSAPTELTDLRVRFDNVEMPQLSPYTATFAGRTIASGRLWLDLAYKIVDGELAGDNKIAVEDLALGERVEAPDALDLPLDLAVALLKDDRGRIDLAIPVVGDMDNPRFDYRAVIIGAIARTLRRIVTAPFRALGRLLGGESGERLEEVEFAPGSDRLAPAEEEDLTEVAAVLQKRPGFKLTVAAPYDPVRDAGALREDAMRRTLALALGRDPTADEPPGPVDFGDPRTRKTLEAMAAERLGAGTAEAVPTGSDVTDGEQAEADAGDRYRRLYARLAEALPVGEEDLQRLAAARARTIADFLRDRGQVEPERVETGEIRAVREEGESVPARLELGLREEAS